MGELLALTWDDVDFKKQSICISKNLERVQTYHEDGTHDRTKLIVQDSAKSKKGIRTIPLQEDVFKMLVIHQQHQLDENLPNPLGLVFPSKVGTYTDPRTYQKRIAAVSKRCEILHVNVHALRHTFATRLVERRVSLKIIQNLLGHASIATAVRYTHALEDEKEKAVNRMNDIFQPAAEKKNSTELP